MTETFSRFDAAEFLDEEEDVAAYLAAAAEDGDPAAITAALSAIARARNMSEIARNAGLTREGLYKALSPDGNPGFTTVAKIASALGFSVSFAPINAIKDTIGLQATTVARLRKSARNVFISHGPALVNMLNREPAAPAKRSRSKKPAATAKAKAAPPAKPKAAGVRSRRPAQTSA